DGVRLGDNLVGTARRPARRVFHAGDGPSLLGDRGQRRNLYRDVRALAARGPGGRGRGYGRNNSLYIGSIDARLDLLAFDTVGILWGSRSCGGSLKNVWQRSRRVILNGIGFVRNRRLHLG